MFIVTQAHSNTLKHKSKQEKSTVKSRFCFIFEDFKEVYTFSFWDLKLLPGPALLPFGAFKPHMKRAFSPKKNQQYKKQTEICQQVPPKPNVFL
jgi:hypothetical protein